MHSLSKIQGMHDTTSPNHQNLFDIASEQHGYFTAKQARACGFNWDLLSHHTRTGRFLRIRRGLYRLRDYPSFPREEVVVAWLAAGKDSSVVSHDSALDLLDLSDVIPQAVHLTVPRSKRYLRRAPGVIFHTTTEKFSPGDLTFREGIRETSAARTIVDAAEDGTAPEQIEMAVVQAIDRGLTTPTRLTEATMGHSSRVLALINRSIKRVRP